MSETWRQRRKREQRGGKLSDDDAKRKRDEIDKLNLNYKPMTPEEREAAGREEQALYERGYLPYQGPPFKGRS